MFQVRTDLVSDKNSSIVVDADRVMKKEGPGEHNTSIWLKKITLVHYSSFNNESSSILVD